MGVDRPIDITAAQRKTVLVLLKRHLLNTTAWVYGSRVKWTARPQSDLDLVVFATPEQDRRVSELREAFEESNLPFRVDLFIWDAVPKQFREQIEAEHVVLVAKEEQAVPGDWVQTSLADLIDIRHGFAFKGSYINEEESGDVLLTPSNFAIGGGFKDDKFKYYHGSYPEEFILGSGDLLVTMTDLSKQADTLGYPALVSTCPEGRRYLHNQRLGKVMIKDRRSLNARYLYYVMCSTEYRHEVLASATGTTVKHTSPERIKRFRFHLPSPPEQRAIAHVLGTLDDKIELNRRMNETLEAMARALFKSWFVDFDPVRAKMEGRDTGLPKRIADLFPDRLVGSELGDIPEGWEVKPLFEIADFLNGLALQKYPANDPTCSLPVIKIAELRSGITGKTDRASRNIPSKYVVKDGDFLFSWSGSLLAKFWADGEGALNQHLFKVTSKRYPLWFVAEWIHVHLDDFRDIAAFKATTMGHIQRNHLQTAMTICPSDNTTMTLGAVIEPLVESTTQNHLQSRTLVKLRDVLLSKLVSGEIRIRDAKKAVETATT